MGLWDIGVYCREYCVVEVNGQADRWGGMGGTSEDTGSSYLRSLYWGI